MPTILRGILLIAALMLSGGANCEEDAQAANFPIEARRASAHDQETKTTGYFKRGYCLGVIDALATATKGTTPARRQKSLLPNEKAI
jgi:hypothetical protein